ncbi:endonuclease/exonuclease/phosphatase family domain-containing protein 1-like [Agrilus planipennis]|uniref:Endonuclease/exonuclease/phosphatase family domain-containing protein 1-like n=1 Tax=Agrilus planipennis TaxID=224129 RepID=A0A1W4WTN7_AGRPL|nr:endonuclease/exonuclease/phosphatase family domain-containing protein 1-like [Agrilus planipennis]
MSNTQLRTTSSISPIHDVYDLLSKYSYRPIVEEFNYERHSKQAIRIASWNLDNLTQEKARNLGVVEVICCTILDYKWSLVAIQGVRELLALKIICDELNRPTLPCIKIMKDNSRSWKYCMCDTKTGLGFIYDSVSNEWGVDIASLSHEIIDECQSIIITFSIKGVAFTIINVGSISSSAEEFEKSLRELLQNFTGPVLVVGDVNKITEQTEGNIIKELATLKAVIPLSLNTSCQHLKSNLRFTDTILINNVAQTAYYDDEWGVVREGLTHLAIPEGWDWGGAASTHCPVWAEFYVAPNKVLLESWKISLESDKGN